MWDSWVGMRLIISSVLILRTMIRILMTWLYLGVKILSSVALFDFLATVARLLGMFDRL
jgi:hypothetical protein